MNEIRIQHLKEEIPRLKEKLKDKVRYDTPQSNSFKKTDGLADVKAAIKRYTAELKALDV